MRAELESLAASLGIAGAVTFAGFLPQSELRELYATSHIFVHPSETPPNLDQEGVPNSMLEAMATGLPVAATRHGGIPEAVADGVSGLLVAERDSGALADALFRLATTPGLAAELGRGAAQGVREDFEQASAIARLEGFYDEAIALGKPQT